MITVTCTEKLRDKNNRIVGYELQDCNGNKMRFTSEQVKQAVFLQQITITNLKLTSDGRLIDSTESVQSDDKSKSQSKSLESNQLALINKLKNMKCYQIMRLSVDDIAHLIEKMSNIKLEEIPFINYEQGGMVSKLYFSGCIPFLITKRDTKELNCEHCSRAKTDEHDKVEDCYVEIPFPSDDEKYSTYPWGNGDVKYNTFFVYANEVKALVKVASIWKNIPNTKISYGDVAYALQELMLKYVDTKYATVNNVLKLHSDVIYDDDEWNKVETDITTLAFTIYYKENIYIGKKHKQEIDVQVVNVFMSLTKVGYKIQVLDYKYEVAYDYRHILDILEDEDNCSGTTIGFNDNLKNAMRKVKLLIDDKFKSSLKDVKDSVKEIKNKYKNGYVY